jgi:copper chaperone CopZ
MKSIIFLITFILTSNVFAANTEYLIQVDTLDCPFCSFGIEKQLRRNIDGIEDLEVNVKKAQVRLFIDEDISLDEIFVRKTVNEAGFALEDFYIIK